VDEAEDDTQTYLESKRAKDIFDQGLDVFKRSPKRGIRFFIEHEICGGDSQAIADFLFATPALDATGVGEVLGGPDAANREILQLFVAHFEFANLSFEAAFRQFLSKFQIPGEAQMIDRVMEQFGRKFYNDNPSLFSCADTVYVLAFSTLMLHTDAHHPNVKQRMSLEDFVTNNKRIDGGKDLPFSFLETLYKGITAKRINLTASAGPPSSLMTREQKVELYKGKCAQTLANARTKTEVGTDRHFHRAESALLIGPMYRSVWRQILSAFTMAFEDAKDRELIDLCLQGFQLAIHIASHSFVDEALQTTIDSFAKFTRLKSLPDIHEKNLLCAHALILCAIEDRNFLKGHWLTVLGEISALERLKQNPNFIGNFAAVEELFTQTASLDRESILDFASAMAATTILEVSEENPRTFMLLKFSEVSYWNMDRPMFVWVEFWNIIGACLCTVGNYAVELIAETTVDIIRQLALRFLQKDEMRDFHFQKHFLAPFLDIFEKQSSDRIRERVLDYVDSIVFASATKLHSGWDIFLQILHTVPLKEEPRLRLEGFRILEGIIIGLRETPPAERLCLLMNVLGFFVTKDIDRAQQAVTDFLVVAKWIPPTDTDTWIVLLQHLGHAASPVDPDLVEDPAEIDLRGAVRKCAEESLVAVMTVYGLKADFAPEVWHFFLSRTLFDLIPVPAVSEEEAKHSLGVVQYVNTHLLTKFPEVIATFHEYVLNFWVHCCSSKFAPLRDATVGFLQAYVATHITAFRAPELAELLMSALGKLVPAMLDCVLFVEMIGAFIGLYEGDERPTAQMMHLLNAISTECLKSKDEKAPDCVCAARRSYFGQLVAQTREDDTAAYLAKTLELYLSAEKRIPVWNELIVFFLDTVAGLGDSGYAKCSASALRSICQLIEAESRAVRDHMIPVLKRRLEQ
jgi:hypothetical protein